MTEQQARRLLPAIRALAEDIRAEELAELPPAWARAVQFYAAAREGASDEERLLALYNGFGALQGFDAARSAVEKTIGDAEAALRAVRGEGDCESAPSHLRCGEEQLAALTALLRKALLAPGKRDEQR